MKVYGSRDNPCSNPVSKIHFYPKYVGLVWNGLVSSPKSCGLEIVEAVKVTSESARVMPQR